MVGIAGFARTTIALIVVCALGVAGQIDGLSIHRGRMVAHTTAYIELAYGGFIWCQDGTPEERVDHEWGHLEQEAALGILYEFLVVTPSLISATLCAFGLRAPEQHLAMPFEREATSIGER